MLLELKCVESLPLKERDKGGENVYYLEGLRVNAKKIGYVCDLSEPCELYAFHVTKSYDCDS